MTLAGMALELVTDGEQCDGSSPCSRCRTDNAICVFGERKKAHDKVYPKGCVNLNPRSHVGTLLT